MQALFQVQSRWFAWAYVIWLSLAFLPTATCCVVAESSDSAVQLLILALAFAAIIAVVQIARPTLLGWQLLFVPTLFYTVVSTYHILRYPPVAEHPPPYHADDLWPSPDFTAALGVSCAVLFLIRFTFRFHPPST